jgi:hypothetical protein
MGPKSLVSEQIESGAKFLFEFQKKYGPLSAAFWMKPEDTRSEYLYVGSEKITDENFVVAYREVGRIVRELEDPWLDVSYIRLIYGDERLTEVVRNIYAVPVHVKKGKWLFDTPLGSSLAEEAYFYPLPIPEPVLQKVD